MNGDIVLADRNPRATSPYGSFNDTGEPRRTNRRTGSGVRVGGCGAQRSLTLRAALAMAPVSSSVRHHRSLCRRSFAWNKEAERSTPPGCPARAPWWAVRSVAALAREAHRPAAPQALDVSSRGIDVRDSAPGLLASTASPSYCASMKEHPRSAAIRKRPSEARRGAIQKRNACCPNRFQPPRHALSHRPPSSTRPS